MLIVVNLNQHDGVNCGLIVQYYKLQYFCSGHSALLRLLSRVFGPKESTGYVSANLKVPRYHVLIIVCVCVGLDFNLLFRVSVIPDKE